LFRAISQEPDGKAIFNKFAIRATPTVLLLADDGSEIDWTVGYDPPAEKFQELLEKMISGTETYKALSAAYAKNPKDVATIFKLGQKWSDRYDLAKSQEKYKELLALDPDGKMGTTEYQKEKVSYTEYAEFNLGTTALSSRPPVPAPLLAFIKKYPESAIVKDAYRSLGRSYFGRTAPKEEAVKFFEEYTARYPQDPMVLSTYVRRIIQDKDNLDKGLDLAQKAVDLSQGGGKLAMLQSLGQIYLLKGDKTKAAETAEMIVKIDAEGNKGMATAIPMTEAMPSGPGVIMSSSSSLMGAARIFVEADKMDRALAIYGPDYLKKNIDKPGAAAGYASFWARQNKNLASALEAAKKAVELTPDNFSIWNTLSQINLNLKKYDDALKAAEKAVETAPNEQLKNVYRKQIDQIKVAAQEKK
jgi:tetratricopeptide (TPR) repeat protein